MRSEQRALRAAQEAIEQHGEWHEPKSWPGGHETARDYFVEEWLQPLLFMGACALTFMALTGQLDGVCAQFFAFIGG